MICKICGKEVEGVFKTCPICGAPTEQSTTSLVNDEHSKKHNHGIIQDRHQTNLILRIISIVVILSIVFIWYIFFMNNEPIYNVSMSANIDPVTGNPITTQDVFLTTTSEIFVVFDMRELENESEIKAIWLNKDTSTIIETDISLVSLIDDITYFSMISPTTQWMSGEYEVQLYINDELIITKYFTISETIE